jgi:hypothetical protein
MSTAGVYEKHRMKTLSYQNKGMLAASYVFLNSPNDVSNPELSMKIFSTLTIGKIIAKQTPLLGISIQFSCSCLSFWLYILLRCIHVMHHIFVS